MDTANLPTIEAFHSCRSANRFDFIKNSRREVFNVLFSCENTPVELLNVSWDQGLCVWNLTTACKILRTIWRQRKRKTNLSFLHNCHFSWAFFQRLDTECGLACLRVICWDKCLRVRLFRVFWAEIVLCVVAVAALEPSRRPESSFVDVLRKLACCRWRVRWVCRTKEPSCVSGRQTLPHWTCAPGKSSVWIYTCSSASGESPHNCPQTWSIGATSGPDPSSVSPTCRWTGMETRCSNTSFLQGRSHRLTIRYNGAISDDRGALNVTIFGHVHSVRQMPQATPRMPEAFIDFNGRHIDAIIEWVRICFFFHFLHSHENHQDFWRAVHLRSIWVEFVLFGLLLVSAWSAEAGEHSFIKRRLLEEREQYENFVMWLIVICPRCVQTHSSQREHVLPSAVLCAMFANMESWSKIPLLGGVDTQKLAVAKASDLSELPSAAIRWNDDKTKMFLFFLLLTGAWLRDNRRQKRQSDRHRRLCGDDAHFVQTTKLQVRIPHLFLPLVRTSIVSSGNLHS